MDFRLLLVALSVAASARYLYWRIFHSLATFTWIEMVFSAIVLLAEIYGITILFLGYFQTFSLKDRQSVPLPADSQEWPTVDVLVVTYDEQVKVLRRTLVGCLKMDYPSEKKRIYLLDDGRRQEMRDLADELGCHYIVRPDNKYAKAGNLNNALWQTDGEIVAIFDADQIPVKSFLTETVGFMLADPKCALVQTPQHAYTNSPFEHNLGLTDKIASEDAFFYRVAQVGNDYWNSAYFCGCCAILRRTSLEKIGGIAVETVGEDAHTSMRLHAAGFNSVYYNKPLAAGVATARFGEYLSQRLRWGRGMTQIFRIENPLFVRGLSLPQRINYFLAILHFFGGLPRLALVLAPLAYLLIGWRPLSCNNWDILFYAGPHIFFALVTMSWMSKNYRQSFWSEVFQSATAIFLIPVTFLALINPRFGKFTVTSKRLVNEHQSLDIKHIWPMILMIGISLVAVIIAMPSHWVSWPDQHTALLINSGWAFHNLFILTAVVLAARDKVQLRSAPRINLALSSRITAPGYPEIKGEVTDLSETGTRLIVSQTARLPELVTVSIDSDFGESAVLHARVVWRKNVKNRDAEIGLVFEGMDRDTLHSVISLAFCAPGRWLRTRIRRDNPLRSYWYIISSPWRAQGQKGTPIHQQDSIQTPPKRLLNNRPAVINRSPQEIFGKNDKFGVQLAESHVPTNSLQVTPKPVPELKAFGAAGSD